MTLLRVLRTAKANLSRTFYLDETATDATGSVAVSIARLDGTVVDSGAATGPVSNVYTYTFGGRDVLDELVVTWTATVAGDAIVLDQDRLQVVGGFFFSLGEGRAVDAALANTTAFPTSKLIERRIEVENECERITRQAWVPRFRRVQMSGTGYGSVVLPDPYVRAVRSASIGGVALTSPELALLGFDDTGVLRRDGAVIGGTSVWTEGRRNLIVEYEHGHDYPEPEIVRASKIRFKSLLVQPRSPGPDRPQADQGYPPARQDAERTGLPDVDAVYARYPSPLPGFG